MKASFTDHPDLESYFDAPGGIIPEAVRVHAESCERCGQQLRDLRELRRQARALPREIAPPVDLWPGIAERIGQLPARSARSRSPSFVGTRTPGFRRGWWLAAAAAVGILVAGGTLLPALIGLDDGASPVAAVPTSSGDRAAPAAAATPALVAFAEAEPEYRSTVQSLEAELAARRDQLDPATIAVVERNLAIVDSAIAEAKRALAADPSSVELPLLLSGIYRQKLELLQQAALVSSRS